MGETEEKEEWEEHDPLCMHCVRPRRSVRLKGLSQASLNGKTGSVREIRNDSRIVVFVLGHGLLAARRINIEPVHIRGEHAFKKVRPPKPANLTSNAEPTQP